MDYYRLTARMFGVCIAIVGCCVLWTVGLGLLDALALIASILVAIWKLVWFMVGGSLTMVGLIWVFKPERVFATIERTAKKSR